MGNDGDGMSGTPQGPALELWLEALVGADWIGEPGSAAPLILEGHRLYLGKYWHFEQQVAVSLRERVGRADALDLPRRGFSLNVHGYPFDRPVSGPCIVI